MRLGRTTRFCAIVSMLSVNEPTPLRGADCGVFTGSFYGVSATVALDRDAHTANVTLRGLPVGGTLTGAASFREGGVEGALVLEERFAAALRRRRVTLEGAVAAPDGKLHVGVRLPLFGARTLTLACVQRRVRESEGGLL